MAYTPKINDIITYVCSKVADTAGVTAKCVHDGLRDLDDEASLRALHTDPSTHRIHGYQVTVTASPQEDVAAFRNCHVRWHNVLIRGYYQVQDKQTGTTSTSEPQWRYLVESICHSLRQDCTLGGLAQETDPPVVTRYERESFGNLRCHVADIELTIRERILF